MDEWIDIRELVVGLKPLQAVNDQLGPVLSDVESMLPAGHPYRDNDRVTWTHEGTHGVNARIGNELAGPSQEGIYVLEGQAALLPSPPINLSDVAKAVPNELRGDIYQLYLVDQQRWWEDRPLYVFNEWSAYLNGSDYREQNGMKDTRGESCQFMMECLTYSWCCIEAAGYPRNLRRFAIWQAQRTLTSYRNSEMEGRHREYWAKASQHGMWGRSEAEGYISESWLTYWIRGGNVAF